MFKLSSFPGEKTTFSFGKDSEILCHCQNSFHFISRHVIFGPSSTNFYGSSGFAGIGDALADVKGDDDRYRWDEA